MHLPRVENPEQRLTKRELCAYGVGIIAYQFPHTAVSSLAMPIFNVELGLAPATVGAALMVARLWDAVNDPIVGSFSDNTRSRWGRRRPFIFCGAILTGLIYPLLWLAPKGWSQQALAVWLIGGAILLFSAFSIFSVPYSALAHELTPISQERTRIQAWRSYFNIAFSIAVGWLYWLCQRPVFGSPAQGAKWVGLASGCVIILCGVLPALLLREPYYTVASATRKDPFWQAAWATLKNRPNLVLMGIVNTLILGIMTTEALGFYILTYHVYGGDKLAAGKMIGIGSTLAALTGFAVIPLVHFAARRWGKIVALRACLSIYIVVCAAKWLLASPLHPWTWPLIGMLGQFGGIGFWVLVNSMKGDACDWDELHSGKRREGAYAAVGGLVSKISNSLTYFLTGLLVQWAGFNAALGSHQIPMTLLSLRIAFSVGPISFLLVCLWLLHFYRLDQATMLETRRQLELRRAAV